MKAYSRMAIAVAAAEALAAGVTAGDAYAWVEVDGHVGLGVTVDKLKGTATATVTSNRAETVTCNFALYDQASYSGLVDAVSSINAGQAKLRAKDPTGSALVQAGEEFINDATVVGDGPKTQVSPGGTYTDTVYSDTGLVGAVGLVICTTAGAADRDFVVVKAPGSVEATGGDVKPAGSGWDSLGSIFGS